MDNIVANIAAMTCCGVIIVVAIFITTVANNYFFNKITGQPPLTAEDIYRSMITKDGIEP